MCRLQVHIWIEFHLYYLLFCHIHIIDSEFTLTLPNSITETSLPVTIASKNNDFYMKLIEKVSMTKNDSPIEFPKADIVTENKLILESEIIKFSIVYSTGDTYTINSIQRKSEGGSDSEASQKYIFTTGNIITNNQITIINPHQYITLPAGASTGTVTFEITSSNSEILTINYKFTIGGSEPDIPCTRSSGAPKFSCVISDITEAKTVYFTTGSTTINGYISLYSLSESKCYDIDTTTPVNIVIVNTPTGIDSQPTLKLGELTGTSSGGSSPYTY